MSSSFAVSKITINRKCLIIPMIITVACLWPMFNTQCIASLRHYLDLNNADKKVTFREIPVKHAFSGTLQQKKSGYNTSWAWQPMNTWEKHFNEVFQNKNMSLRKSQAVSCNVKFQNTLTERLEVISNYKFSTKKEQRDLLMLNDKDIESLLTQPEVTSTREFPVVVTAASSQFYNNLQEFIGNVHENLMKNRTDVKLIVYDLGLKKEQATKVRKYCKCDYRIFPASKFPKHVSLGPGYAWKPVIIQLVLKEYDLVMWADTSVKFYKSSFDAHISAAKSVGIQLLAGGGKVYQRTKKVTFDKFGEEPCLYGFPEIQAGFSIISRSPFTMKYIMKPWLSCALDYGCMVIPGGLFARNCSGNKEYHRCHRFDQSVLSMLLTRIFVEKRELFLFRCQTFADVVRKKTSVRYIDDLANSKLKQ